MSILLLKKVTCTSSMLSKKLRTQAKIYMSWCMRAPGKLSPAVYTHAQRKFYTVLRGR